MLSAYNGDFGLVNQFLALLHIKGPNWLQNEYTVKPAIIMMSVWKGLGVSMLFYLAALQSISPTFRVPLSFVVVMTGLIFYAVSYFLSFENGVEPKAAAPYLLTMSILASEMALISLVWIVNYPVYTVTERGNLSGLPLPAILLTIVFYFVWGVFSHKIDKSLTRRVIIEYVLLTLVFVFVLLFTAKWIPAI
jgi:hypothetical protein